MKGLFVVVSELKKDSTALELLLIGTLIIGYNWI